MMSTKCLPDIGCSYLAQQAAQSRELLEVVVGVLSQCYARRRDVRLCGTDHLLGDLQVFTLQRPCRFCRCLLPQVPRVPPACLVTSKPASFSMLGDLYPQKAS